MATLRFRNGSGDDFAARVRALPPTTATPPRVSSAASIPGVGNSATRVQATRGGGLRTYQVKRAGTPRGRHADAFGPTPPRNKNATGNTGLRLALAAGVAHPAPRDLDAFRDGTPAPRRAPVVPTSDRHRPECGCPVGPDVAHHVHRDAGVDWKRDA